MAYDWTSLAVQWLRFRASTAWSTGQIPGWGTKIPHAAWHGLKINKKIKIKIKKKCLKSAFTFLHVCLGFE